MKHQNAGASVLVKLVANRDSIKGRDTHNTVPTGVCSTIILVTLVFEL